MIGRQLDLFSEHGRSAERTPSASRSPHRIPRPADLDDAALIAAIPDAGVADAPALAAEAGRRRLGAAVATLEALCRRFAGFGVERVIPEQAVALEALVRIGGADARRAVARLLARRVVQGPGLAVAVASAARLGADLPAGIVLGLLRHADPRIRAGACGCVRAWPDVLPVLADLLDDLNPDVSRAAACALGRLGRAEARPALLRLLRGSPSIDVIDAMSPVADEEAVILLGRIARTRPDLAGPARAALEASDHPRAAQVLAGLAIRGGR